MRVFIAADLRQELRDSLAERMREFSTRIGRNRVAWVRPDQLHFTARFIGETSAAVIDALLARLRADLAGTGAFTVALAGMGTFPSTIDRAKIIWLGATQGADKLASCATAADAASVAVCGCPPEERPFVPHLTVGRMRTLIDQRALGDFLAANAATSFGTTEIDSLTLYESVLGTDGPLYLKLGTVPL